MVREKSMNVERGTMPIHSLFCDQDDQAVIANHREDMGYVVSILIEDYVY
jgi:hypothetical protein